MCRRHVAELRDIDFPLHDEGMQAHNQSQDTEISDTYQITHDQLESILNEGEVVQLYVINLEHCDIVIQVHLN